MRVFDARAETPGMSGRHAAFASGAWENARGAFDRAIATRESAEMSRF
jgi:hypothetical protein